MKKTNREATIGIPEDYAEELSPLLLPGRRAKFCEDSLKFSKPIKIVIILNCNCSTSFQFTLSHTLGRGGAPTAGTLRSRPCAAACGR